MPDTHATTEAQARLAIAARSRAFEQAYAAGDAAALVAAYFVDDALAPMACPPGGQAPVIGRAALVAMFNDMFAAMPHIRLQTEQLVVDQAQAFELGRAHLTAADGAPATGRYTVCWLKTHDEWRAKVDFFAEDGWAD
jgi:ketosteroid isomerase-like protein